MPGPLSVLLIKITVIIIITSTHLDIYTGKNKLYITGSHATREMLLPLPFICWKFLKNKEKWGVEQKKPFLLIVRGDKMMHSPVQRNTFLLHTDVLFSFCIMLQLYLLSSLHLFKFQLFQSFLTTKDLGTINKIESTGQDMALVYLKISHAIISDYSYSKSNELLKCLLNLWTTIFL